ncbi:iron complex outermembrane receptor protein [Sphingobium xenophagum]|uniref:Iron complex outermembrane receptor protein n=1 Tax=Sphingobium xenophagum TaxID=121428 RepID=A0ABU1X1X3_SPHXE|nr:TonB-dependent receptor [Sphingobium xenophagum]MDR7155577.1 iron complex outermembrane receptor protein [Sphingobium xenophagum]
MQRNLLVRPVMLALGSTLLWAMPATAQDQTAQPQADAQQADPNAIIVTARRRNESLQDTPVAITAVNAAMLENKAAVNIGDLTGAAPNLLITNQNAGAAAANLAIRGLTYADVEKSQEPTVGVVVDGVFIGTSTGQFFDFFDIEQIEVLRGPQGTLFGRNTIGGVINIRRTRPTGEFGAKMEVSYGKFDSLATRAVVNVPLSNDGSVGAKFFYFHSETDGWYRQAQTGERRGFSNNENFGGSLLFAPQGSGFDALFTLEKQVQKSDPVVSNLTQTGEAFCGLIPAIECNRNNRGDLYTVFGQANVTNYSAPAATLEMNYDLGDIKLTSVTGWRDSRENQTQDFDGSSTDLYYVRRQQQYEQWSQEIRAAGKLSDSFDYVVGLFYFSSKYELAQYSRVFGFAPDVDPLIFDTNPQVVNGKTKSIAAFGDFNWAFADQWRLSFGGRFTRDKKSLDNSFGGIEIGRGTDTFKKFTPKVGVDFRPNSDMMFYGSWSQGYRSGGFSPRAGTAASAGIAYQPEVVDSFEVGGKFDLFDRKLQFNVAAFYSSYKDLHQNNTLSCPSCATGNETITSNVGSAKIKGLEFDFTARPTTQLTITGSMGLLDSKFKGFIVGGLSPVSGAVVPYDYSRNDLIYNPNMTASLAADYTIPTGFGEVIANLSYRYIGAYDQQISLGPLSGDLTNGPIIVNGNDPRVRTDKQGLVDASLTTKFALGGTEARLTVFGRNLANDRGPTHGFTVGGLWSFGTAREPRTYGATLGVKF